MRDDGRLNLCNVTIHMNFQLKVALLAIFTEFIASHAEKKTCQLSIEN